MLALFITKGNFLLLPSFGQSLIVKSPPVGSFYEPESEIISRTGDVCIVASCYQWFMKYGEEVWKENVRRHLLSDNFTAYNTKTQHEFELIIDWLKEWGCTRTQGLGT